MNKFKRLISTAAAATIATSMLASSALASIPSDVRGTEYESEATVLGALEIMVGDAGADTFRPDDTIIRSEVTKVGVALMGLSQVADSSAGVSFYPDVDKDHWANGFINVATAQDLVIGDDTGTFRPDDEIKYSEAVAILVRALGYEPQASSKGGYPSGYIATASSIGLTKGVSGSASTLISRGDVARLAYNALTINLMEQTGFGSNVNYEVTDKTLLEDKLDTVKVTGKVEAIGSSAIDASSGLEKNEIKISGTVYNAGDVDTRTLLGFNVDAYVTKGSGKQQTLIAAIPSEGKNNVVTIASDMIEKIENSESSRVIHWHEDESSNTVTKSAIEANGYLVYNGKAADFDKLTEIESGSIILLDSDGNKKYDVVFVNETINYVVDDVFPASHKITDKYDLPALELDTEDESKTIFIKIGSEDADLKDLKEWDIVSVTKSEDEELIYATVSRKSVSGKITEADDDHVYIGGEKYKKASNYPHSFALGDEGTFYLDIDGKIAAYDGKVAKSSNYAYLEDAAISSGMDKVLNLKVFTKEGKLEVLSGAKKIRVNSRSGLTPEEALDAIGEGGKLITIEKNSKGEVTKINTSKVSDTIDESTFVQNLAEENVVYRAKSSKLMASSGNVTVGNDTVIFDIPADGSVDEYAVRDKSIFSDGGLYNIIVYDMTEDLKAGVIIVTNSVAKADEASSAAVIDKITTARNDNDEVIHKLYAFVDGESKTFVTVDDTILKNSEGKLLSQGDVIQYRANSKGEIDAITLLFESSKSETEFKTEHSDDHVTLYGKITKKFSDSVNVSINDGSAENYSFENAKIYVYDSSRSSKKLKAGDSSDLQSYENDGGRVFVRIYKDEVKEILVVK